jgi:hypothetical protein
MADAPTSRLWRSVTTVLLAAVVAALAIAACTRAQPGTASAQPAPHVFPDLSQFTEASPDTFHQPLRGGPSYVFYTPGGIVCTITLGTMGCSGKFSAQPYAADTTTCSFAQPADQTGPNPAHTYTISTLDQCPSAPTASDPVLPAGHKLDVVSPPDTSFTCAVGPAERVACIDQIRKHGFVIEPTGAWTF